MKQFFLFIFSTLLLHKVEACKCRERSFSEELQKSDQVFVGRVLGKTVDSQVVYTFKIIKVYKGTANDTTSISTGLGGGDCGVRFEPGLNYLVFATNGATNRCRKNGLEKDNKELNKLAFLYDRTPASGIGTNSTPLLTDAEADYLNIELMPERNSFDFRNKKVAFVNNNSVSNKQAYFTQQGGKEVVHNLLLLTAEEKTLSNGYDAIVVYWRKMPLTKKLRKKWVRELGARN